MSADKDIPTPKIPLDTHSADSPDTQSVVPKTVLDDSIKDSGCIELYRHYARTKPDEDRRKALAEFVAYVEYRENKATIKALRDLLMDDQQFRPISDLAGQVVGVTNIRRKIDDLSNEN